MMIVTTSKTLSEFWGKNHFHRTSGNWRRNWKVSLIARVWWISIYQAIKLDSRLHACAIEYHIKPHFHFMMVFEKFLQRPGISLTRVFNLSSDKTRLKFTHLRDWIPHTVCCTGNSKISFLLHYHIGYKFSQIWTSNKTKTNQNEK